MVSPPQRQYSKGVYDQTRARQSSCTSLQLPLIFLRRVQAASCRERLGEKTSCDTFGQPSDGGLVQNAASTLTVPAMRSSHSAGTTCNRNSAFLKGASRRVANRATNGAFVSNPSVKIHPPSRYYWPELDLGAPVEIIWRYFSLSSLKPGTYLSLAATLKTHLYHWIAYCLLFPATREHQSQQIN